MGGEAEQEWLQDVGEPQELPCGRREIETSLACLFHLPLKVKTSAQDSIFLHGGGGCSVSKVQVRIKEDRALSRSRSPRPSTHDDLYAVCGNVCPITVFYRG